MSTGNPPPIGLRPESVFNEMQNQSRLGEIIGAIRRYAGAEKPIPLAWVDELERRVNTLIKTPR